MMIITKRVLLTFSIILLTLGLVTIPVDSVQGNDRLSVGGYYKSFFVGYFLPTIWESGPITMYDAPALGSVVNRLRLDARIRPHSAIQVDIAYDFTPTVQDNILNSMTSNYSIPNVENYRFDDFDPRIYPLISNPVASFAIFHNLDRAMISIRTAFADYYIGRQPIAFGSARVINPTDILVPFNYQSLDTEDRLGVDAVRVRVPLGMTSELDLGVVAGTDLYSKNSAAFVRGQFNFSKVDCSILAMAFRENLLIGIDITRPLGGAGLWLEASRVFVNQFSDKSDNGENYFRASVGIDYAFSGESYSFLEYHYNQAGESQPDDYFQAGTKTAYVEGAVYLLGQHYLTPGISYQLSPLWTSSAQLLTNLSDGSFYLSLNLEYNIAENIYLSSGAFVASGKPIGDTMVMGSEFGTYPNVLFSSFRAYF